MTIAGSGAGHGGKKTNGSWRDGGAYGNGYNEADVTRIINEKIIALTGAKDTTDNLGTSVNDNLNRIAQNINKAPDGYHLSNHLNAFNGKATGVEVLYGNVNQKAVAAKVSKAIANALGIVDRGAKDGSLLAIARGTGAGKKVLLIEWCFIDNKSDMQKLMANMDKAISAMLSVFGYSTTVQPPKTETKPTTSTGLAKNTKPLTDGKVGDTVKVYDALYADSTGAGRSTAKRGATGVIKRIVGNNKKYLIENWGWAHANDIQLVKRATATTASKPTATPKVAQIATDGIWGSDTTKRLQQVLGTPVDGIISGQDSRYIKNIPSARTGSGGSQLIKAIQKKLGITADGYLGPNTIKAMQKHYGTPIDGVVSAKSNMVIAMQKALNSNKF